MYVLQTFVSEDGGVGSVLEHSGGDGPPAIAIDTFMLELKLVYLKEIFVTRNCFFLFSTGV